MRRREFITLLSGAVLLPQVGRAQGISKIPRLGFLGVTFASSWASRSEALQLGLRNLGYEHGKNIVIEDLWAEESYDRLPRTGSGARSSQGRYYPDLWRVP
jgi:putative ABC transport system substrate-binding protein